MKLRTILACGFCALASSVFAGEMTELKTVVLCSEHPSITKESVEDYYSGTSENFKIEEVVMGDAFSGDAMKAHFIYFGKGETISDEAEKCLARFPTPQDENYQGGYSDIINQYAQDIKGMDIVAGWAPVKSEANPVHIVIGQSDDAEAIFADLESNIVW